MGLISSTRRNCKLFFKDKGMFFTSLITPVILLVLYATFLGKVYKDSFNSAMPAGFTAEEGLIDGVVGGELISSILAVACVTVAFCSNLLMVNDKVTGVKHDLTMAPVKSSTLAMSYFFATFIATLIICFTALAVCLVYLAKVAWYLSTTDVFLMILDVVLLVLFGTALSSIINAPLSSAGQGSAVGTIVSAGYGFICGAYMPISSFGSGLQKALSYLPGTYGTSLIRNHALAGTYREMEAESFPQEVIDGIKDSIDCNLYFNGDKVTIGSMYIVLVASITVLIAIYILYNMLKARAKD